MNSKELEIANLIMREVGLEVGQANRIIDQDTGLEITLGDKGLVAPGAYCGRSVTEFDPYNNRKLMGSIFGMFLEKHSEDTGVDALTYYGLDEDKKTQKGRIACRMSDDTIITSRPYIRDSLKFADIILQLNGEENVDLSEYDGMPDTPSVKRRGRK